MARAVGRHLDDRTPLLLDARSLDAAPDLARKRLVLVPNASEAADLAGRAEGGQAEVDQLARELCASLGSVVAVRGESTSVASGAGCWASAGHPGLGTAGSGDVLSGAAAGLAARGADPLVALGWAVAAHAAAGALAAEALDGPGYGYTARDLVDRLPAAVAAIEARLAGAR